MCPSAKIVARPGWLWWLASSEWLSCAHIRHPELLLEEEEGLSRTHAKRTPFRYYWLLHMMKSRSGPRRRSLFRASRCRRAYSCTANNCVKMASHSPKEGAATAQVQHSSLMTYQFCMHACCELGALLMAYLLNSCLQNGLEFLGHLHVLISIAATPCTLAPA